MSRANVSCFIIASLQFHTSCLPFAFIIEVTWWLSLLSSPPFHSIHSLLLIHHGGTVQVSNLKIHAGKTLWRKFGSRNRNANKTLVMAVPIPSTTELLRLLPTTTMVKYLTLDHPLDTVVLLDTTVQEMDTVSGSAQNLREEY